MIDINILLKEYLEKEASLFKHFQADERLADVNVADFANLLDNVIDKQLILNIAKKYIGEGKFNKLTPEFVWFVEGYRIWDNGTIFIPSTARIDLHLRMGADLVFYWHNTDNEITCNDYSDNDLTIWEWDSRTEKWIQVQ